MVQDSVLLIVGLPVIAAWGWWRWANRPEDRAGTIVAALFAGYLLLVLAATMFPIVLAENPSEIDWNWNLVPFRGLFDDGNVSRPQALPNVLLGVPFGFLAFFVLRRPSAGRVLAAGTAMFIGIELLQLVVVTLAPGSPRTADITDVILNVAGVAIGIGLFGWVSGLVRRMAADGSLRTDGAIESYLVAVVERADGAWRVRRD